MTDATSSPEVSCLILRSGQMRAPQRGRSDLVHHSRQPGFIGGKVEARIVVDVIGESANSATSRSDCCNLVVVVFRLSRGI